MFTNSNTNSGQAVDRGALALSFDIHYGQGAWRNPALSYERNLWEKAYGASERQVKALMRTDLEASRVFAMATKAGFTLDKAGNYLCTAQQLLTIARELRLADAPAAPAYAAPSHWTDEAEESAPSAEQPR